MKYLKYFIQTVVYTLVISIALLYITGYDYILKGIQVVYFTGHTTAFITDQIYFENEIIMPSTAPQPWKIHEKYNTVPATSVLSELNKELGTVAFIIIKNDSIWYEEYADGFDKTSQTNSFSMAKSITSALLGKAIQEGYIKNLEQPVSDFYPQFDASLTVGDLSSMASGLNWDESYSSPFSLTARSYFGSDLAKTILSLEVTETPGASFKYLSGNTELLGMVIEKATQKKLANYLSESFWEPMGAVQAALWQVDDGEHRLVKSYCCLASNARDFARFGKLYSNQGVWNGTQLLDSSFVTASTTPRFEESPEYGYGFWLSNHLDKKIHVMRGILGQYVISIPEDNLIIVRLGHQRGNPIGKPFSSDFYTYLEEAYSMLESN